MLNEQNILKNVDSHPVGLSDLLAVYKKYKHLDSVFNLTKQFNPNKIVNDENDPFHIACSDMWDAIKKTLTKE